MKSMMKRIFCLLLASACLFTLMPAIAMNASAATAYRLTELLASNSIKPLGRTKTNLAGTGILTDWPGSGFQMNVSGNGGQLQVALNTNYSSNWAVLVDDEQVYWERLGSGSTITASIPAGNHTVTVIKESDASSSTTAYCEMTTMNFAGTIEQPPAQKDVLIEFIGDSYTCGHGTLGVYTPGVAWGNEDHSFLHAYPYYATQKLDADYTIAARGGIGLFTGISTEQGDNNAVTMHDIYVNAAGYRRSEGEYDFEARKEPDVVVVHLGANDGTSTTAGKTLNDWKGKMAAFVDTLREKNPNAAIVMVNHRADKFRMIMQLVDERATTDPNLYCFSFTHQTRGSAAKTTQYYGHPSAADSQELGEALADFLVERGLIPQEEETVTYNDINYYVAQAGNDSNTGKTESAAKLTVKGAMAQAKADYPNGFPNGSRLVVNVTGTVNFNDVSAPALGNVGELKLQDGNDVPILLTTNNYTDTKAVVDTGHAPVDTNDWKVYFCHSMTLKDITFQSTTNSAVGIRDYVLYAGYNQVVFDNVTFKQIGTTPTSHNYGWIVSAGHVDGSVAIPTVATTSSVTFRNGDYTNVIRATCVQNESLSDGTSSIPNVHCELIIEDGAKMATVHNRYGRLTYGSCTVYMKGGSINQYYGTKSFTSSARGTYQGDVNFVMTGGNVYGSGFYGADSYANVTGAINNTISGGVIKLSATADYQNMCFGSRGYATIGAVNNTISGGNFFIMLNKASFKGGYYFGGMYELKITGSVTNRITGGSFLPLNGTGTSGGVNFHFGMVSGSIAKELRNEIVGGTFDVAGTTNSEFRFGGPNPNVPIAKVVNILGDPTDLGSGPMFMNTTVSDTTKSAILLGSTWASIGVTSTPTGLPSVSDCTDEVVLSNTIYGGFFYNNIYCGPTLKHSTTSSYYSFVKGSIENNIYGGYFRGTLYGAGKADVYGKVTTNVHGGCIGVLYAGGDAATVYDGVELNIYDIRENHDVFPTNAWRFWGGSNNADIPVPQTEGRDSVKVTVAPTRDDLVLKTPVAAICKNGKLIMGTKSVTVSGGIYPEGFAIEDVTVNEAIAEGYMIIDTATKKVLTFADDATSTGTTSVTIVKKINDGWAEEDGKWYFYEDGEKVTNTWKKDDTGWRYLNAEGAVVENAWVKDGGKWYYLDANGYMVSNKWMKDSTGWVYLGKDGAMMTNAWVRDSVGWCYVGANGYAVTNTWKKDSTGWCYLNSEGSMTINKWVKDGGKWYYLDANGYMVSNKWMKDSTGWVYLGADGAMLTNAWCKDSVGWCYVGADGYAVTNCWKKDSTGWCYLNANGSMTKNAWVKDGGSWYYLDGNGYMISSTSRNIGGKVYKFNASGVCTNP